MEASTATGYRPKVRRRFIDSPAFNIVVVILFIGLRFASGPTANLSYIGIAAYALLGRPHIVRALACCFLFTMVNPGIAPDASGASVGRYLVLLSSAMSAFIHSIIIPRDHSFHKYIGLTILLGVFICFHSLLFSPFVDVSILKAVSWTLAISTLLSAWSGLSVKERWDLSRQLYVGLALILLLSVPLLGMAAGYLINGLGFQGIFNHPQVLGATMAILFSWAAMNLLSSRRQAWKTFALVGGAAFLILLSEARSAGLAALIGIGLALLVGPALSRQPLSRMAPGIFSGRLWIALMAALVVVLILSSDISDVLHQFLTKSGRSGADGLLANYELSRGALIDRMLANIRSYPLTGIGFGIASEPGLMTIERDAILGLPTGAAIEKGVVPIAVIEELGVPGAAFVALWLFLLVRRSAYAGLAPVAVCFTALLLNMGEATLFSPGGFGLLPLILFGWTFAEGAPSARRLRHA